jgi:hypothetical protein
VTKNGSGLPISERLDPRFFGSSTHGKRGANHHPSRLMDYLIESSGIQNHYCISLLPEAVISHGRTTNPSAVAIILVEIKSSKALPRTPRTEKMFLDTKKP